MGYIDEINAFDVWRETNEISPSAINLWYALMQTSNRAMWKNPLTIAISTLEARTSLKRDSIYRARKALQDAGLLKYVERGSNRSTEYLIIPVSQIATQTATQTATQNANDRRLYEYQDSTAVTSPFPSSPTTPRKPRKPTHKQQLVAATALGELVRGTRLTPCPPQGGTLSIPAEMDDTDTIDGYGISN